MKRLFLSLAAAAALSVGLAASAAIAYDTVPTVVDDPVAMHDTSNFVTHLIVEDVLGNTFTSIDVAVDNSISALCRPENAGDAAQRPGGFCDAVAAYSTKSVYGDGFKAPCPAGEEPNPSPPPACIPEV